jgi:cytochrome c oxidase assembly protein subunit 15
MSLFFRINLLTLVLCFGLVALGAFVRLSNAGLGCPDWPGCYGHVGVPEQNHEVAAAEQAFPQRPVEAHKAWKEMIHRYLAGIVGGLIAALAVMALGNRAEPRGLALATAAVVIVQIVFGALTVTMMVNPLIVTTHLMLGLTTLSLLWWMWLSRPRLDAPFALTGPARSLAPLVLLAVVVQIFLGGWTSTNYAATACPDFPTCLGSYAPAAPLGDAFTLWHGHDRNYEFGILDGAVRATIHLVHRYGALIISLLTATLALLMLARQSSRGLGLALIGALALQVVIGISLIHFQFPLWLADAHNAGAALLLLTVLAVNFHAFRPLPTTSLGRS